MPNDLLHQILNKVNSIEETVSSIDKRVDSVEQKVDSIDKRVDSTDIKIKSIQSQLDEHNHLLRAIEQKTEVIKAEQENMRHDIAHISGILLKTGEILPLLNLLSKTNGDIGLGIID